MTYDQLVAFTSVAAEGTFTGASDALHKSQPAVSKLIRNLEGELGVVLFDRTRYRATLTDAGSVFYERAAAPADPTYASARAPPDRAARQRARLVAASAERARGRPPVDGDGHRREEGADPRRHGVGRPPGAPGRP